MQRLFEDHDVNTLCQQIKQLDRNRAFYTFIHSQLDRRAAQDEIEKLWAGKDLNGAYLASTVRHIFAHGQLTPHANQSQPKAVNRICNAIADFLLKIIDTEFSKRLDQAD
ncbi:MAG: hypothetical protein KME15_15300 [Drouetiella hepatica Uher 2000/2452]|uniref:Uncharacterized protein n=1 Tax=Drouetiella hepatica Uher 2000/2452 TaxID=904376 RepID=A0A951QCR0_9CYAN|nr:hypothetical protein [Drouetiella hepatica Uher 2000/2452]